MDTKETHSDDSRVRDHLANERTYLAWFRTGIATMGLGIVIAKLKYFLSPQYQHTTSGVIHASNIGLLFNVIGLAMIGFSLYFFLRTRNEIRTNSYQSRSVFIIVLTAGMVAVGLIILWYLLQPPM